MALQRNSRRRSGVILTVFSLLGAYSTNATKAQEAGTATSQVDRFHELETKYIFGFASGADIGIPGERAVELETATSFRKRGGHYSLIEQEVEYEGVPSDRFSYELGAHGTATSAKGVEGIDDRHRIGFSGLTADLRFPILFRGPESRFGLTLKVEPEWQRIDGGTGTFITAFSSGVTFLADTEIVPNRLYAALNLGFVPEVSRPLGASGFERSSSTTLALAMAYRILPKITVGGELQYYRAYQGLLFNNFNGHAVYAGPTLHIQVNSKMQLALAYSRQLAGHAQGDPRSLDLTNFTGDMAKLKFEVEF